MRLSLLPSAELSGQPVAGDAHGRAMLSAARQSSRIWQIHDKYLLLAIQDGLLVVDQHVAHERVRFEEVQDDLESEASASQQLLMPLTVQVSPVEMEAFRSSRELFVRLGFEVREFGPTTLLVDAIPPELRNWGDGDLFYQILSDLIEELEARSEARDAMAASMACHTSIRAGDRLSPSEAETLIARLLKAREPFSCPHGRPILIKIPLQELDRLFHRA
jgi:DNA mismatch repair protein MutL